MSVPTAIRWFLLGLLLLGSSLGQTKPSSPESPNDEAGATAVTPEDSGAEVLLPQTGPEEAAEAAEQEPKGPPMYLLRPVWEIGRHYRCLQRLEAEANVAGLGKQSMAWRQHFGVRPQEGDHGPRLALGIESIRVDLYVANKHNRYYFDSSIPLRFQERKGIQGMLLGQTELFVRNRYELSVGEDGEHSLKVIPNKEEKPVAASAQAYWEQLPWETLTAALLHQGIPEEPLAVDAEWTHREKLGIPMHGHAEWELHCEFTGFKEHEKRTLALVRFKGEMNGTFYRKAGEEGSPGVALILPRMRGLTLIDTEKRLIISTVVKLEGKLKSLGLPGAAENETAPVKKTLTLSLLGVE